MATEPKKSTAAVGNIAPLTDYADGLTSFYVADQYKRSYPVRRDGDVVSSTVDANAFDPSDGNPDEGNVGDETEDPKKDLKKKAPTLDDIEVVSNSVVYDPNTGLPSATVVFKVRNSSGEIINGVNYRVSIS